jgi:ABC-type lipopolysaccharide export system ATPase subunit
LRHAGEIVFEGGVSALEQNELVKNYYLGVSV